MPFPNDDRTPPVMKMNFVFRFVEPVADLAIAVLKSKKENTDRRFMSPLKTHAPDPLVINEA